MSTTSPSEARTRTMLDAHARHTGVNKDYFYRCFLVTRTTGESATANVLFDRKGQSVAILNRELAAAWRSLGLEVIDVRPERGDGR